MVIEPSPDKGLKGRKCFFMEVGSINFGKPTIEMNTCQVTRGTVPQGCFAVSDVLHPFDINIQGIYIGKN